MANNLESGNCAYGDKISYVAISPNGSIVATFDPYDFSISIKKVEANSKEVSITFDRNKFFEKGVSNIVRWTLVTINRYTRISEKPNIIGWSLAVSDIINTKNDTCLVAISCITDKDTNPKEIEKVSSQRAYLKILLNLKARGDSQSF